MKKRRNNEKGFVLLLVLAVLVIASVVLSAWAYRASVGAMNAGEISRDIQRKWGTLSCQKVMLSSAEEILDKESEESKTGPVASVTREIILGDLNYRMVLFDEQAKVNVNSLVKDNSREHIFAQLRLFIQDMKNQPEIHLGMDVDSVQYENLEQLFDCGGDPVRLLEIDRLTCWGNGLVNFNRADAKTIEYVTAGVLNGTDIQKIVAMRKEKQKIKLAEAIKALSMNDKNAAKLKKLLTDNSACKTVWVICSDDSRNWYRQYVNMETTATDKVESPVVEPKDVVIPEEKDLALVQDKSGQAAKENNPTTGPAALGTKKIKSWSYQW